MIKVGIDATQIVEKRTGLGRYQEDLIRCLSDKKDIQIVLFASPENTLPVSTKLEVRVLSKFLSSVSPGLALLLAPSKLLSGIDLFLASRLLRPLSWKGKTLTVVHDLSWLENPRGMQSLSYLAHRLFANRMVMQSDVVVSVSWPTASQIKKLISSNIQVHALPSQISNAFDIPATEVFDRNHLLLVGGQSPGKNGILVMRIFAKLARNMQNLQLTIVGGKSWKNQEMRSEFNRLSDDIRNRIHLAGFVSEEELVQLYRNSALTLFPSYYEGYGYPVLESMACGTPVLASRNIPTADYLPDNYYALDPDDEDSWYEISKSIISEPYQHRDKFIQHWKNIRGNFTGQDYSDKIVELIESACLSR